MQTAAKTEFAGEAGEVRHEYPGGLVYAMAGETVAHNQVAGNLCLDLRRHLKGRPLVPRQPLEGGTDFRRKGECHTDAAQICIIRGIVLRSGLIFKHLR